MQRHQVRSANSHRSREVHVNNDEQYNTDDEEGDIDARISKNLGLLDDVEQLSPSRDVYGDDDYDEDFEEDQDEDDLIARASSMEYGATVTEMHPSKAVDDMVDDEDVVLHEDDFDAPEKEDLSEEEDGLEAKSEGDITKEITIIEGIIEESRARCRESLGESLFQ